MRRTISLLLLGLLSLTNAWADWQGDKYSLFIHYGLYSIAGGVWNNQPVKSGYSEQILTFGVGFADEYEALTEQFDARHFSAQDLVQLALDGGMRSIIITSKHHDGFCLWRTATTSYNVYDATPARRDLIAELASECHRKGLGFGIYFSLIDWHYPYAMPFTSHNADPITPLHHEYNKQQIRELLTQYGAIDELWFDMGSMQKEQSEEMYRLVHQLQPHCMVSGRLGNDFSDFSVMADNEYPDYTMAMPWQTAASIFPETWGYRSWQERGKVQDKVKEKLQALLRVVSQGGKYLLNIGPMGSGAIVDFESQVLRQIGAWIEPVKQAIYDTKPAPWATQEGYPLTTLSPDERTIYLFTPSTAGSQSVVLPPIQNNIIRIESLYGGSNLSRLHPRGKEIHLIMQDPEPNNLYNVFALHLDSPLSIAIPQLKEKNLNPINANPLFTHSQIDYYTGFKSIVGYQWHPAHWSKKATLTFTAQERGREIGLLTDQSSTTLTLTPQDSSLYTTPLRAIHWDRLYTAQGRGRFGVIPQELFQDSCSRWRESPMHFTLKERVSQGTARYLCYTLTLDEDLDLPLAVTFSEGMLCFVDQKPLAGAIYRPTNQETPHQKILRIPLKQGKHTLLLKFYNRESRTLHGSIIPLSTLRLYHQTVQLPTKSTSHLLQITKKIAPPLAFPAHLYGLSLEI